MFDRIKVLGSPLFRSTPDDVAGAEEKLGSRFPAGYADYVCRFGEGILGGSYVRIYPPRRILDGENNCAEWRERVNEYWFWDDGADVLSKQTALQCVIIGDTFDGDELVFHPSDPDRVFILPRYAEVIHAVDGGLEPAIEWLCGAGILTEAFHERDFEPFDSRSEAASS